MKSYEDWVKEMSLSNNKKTSKITIVPVDCLTSTSEMELVTTRYYIHYNEQGEQVKVTTNKEDNISYEK